jgi:guanylate kinase
VKRKYFPVILSAPSGGGKSSIKNLLIKRDRRFVFSITATTREKRKNEIEGKDYYFKNKEEFVKLIKNGFFIEWAKVHNNYYGTPKKSILSILDSGKIPIMTIDVKGAYQVKRIFKDAVSIFILPPSLKVMISRLEKRGEDKENIEIRLNTATKELKYSYNFYYIVINDDIEEAVKEIISIVNSENRRVNRNLDILKKFEREL